MSKRLTNSEMQVWRDCRRKWWLSTYRGLRPARERFNTPASIGNRVHEALALLYDPTNECEDAAQQVRAACEEDIILHPNDEDDIRKEREYAEAMVKGYMEWLEEEGVDAPYTTILGAEEAVEVPLTDDGATLLAKLDVRVEDEAKERWGIDFKAGTTQTEPILLQLNTQALTQHLVEFMRSKEALTGATARGTIFRVLRRVKRTARAKPPFYWQEEVRHSNRELEAHWHHVIGILRDIQAAEARLDAGEDPHVVAYPSPGRECAWKCPFFRICTQFDDGSDVEGAIAELYEEHDPLERYSTVVGSESC